MVLKNYWKWLDGVTSIGEYVGSTDYYVDLGIKDTAGSTFALYFGTTQTADDSRKKVSDNRILTANYGVRIGTGTNVITPDSYRLTSDITSDVSNLNINYSSSGSDVLTKTITLTGKNGSSNSITITEIAYSKKIWRNNKVTLDEYLFAICQLETPLTVLGGDNFTVTLNWTEA